MTGGTGRALTIQRRGALFYLIDEEGTAVGMGYVHRRDADEALGIRLRSSQRTIRPCISCGRPFESSGPHNRMCPRCKSRGGR